MTGTPPDRGAVAAWGLWDWAFSAFNAVSGRRKLWLAINSGVVCIRPGAETPWRAEIMSCDH